MTSINRVTLMGNLGREPRWGVLPSGAMVCNVVLATTEAHEDCLTGETRDIAEWHRAVMIGTLAESLRHRMNKGDGLYLEGRLRTRKWVDRQGVTRYITEILAESAQVFGKSSSTEAQKAGRPGSTLDDPEITAWIADYDLASVRYAAEAAGAAPTYLRFSKVPARRGAV